MDQAQLLGELEDVIRTMPPRDRLSWDSPEVLQWVGRACGVMSTVNRVLGAHFATEAANLSDPMGRLSGPAATRVQVMLYQARTELRLETLGPVNSAIGAGAVFDYFDELRQILETASSDLFFVDPYLDAEFVSRYMPHVRAGVQVRLLTQKCIPQLTPAAQAFSTQSGLSILVRSSGNMHDRLVFVDRSACYQSGASFKDGAKKAPTTLTQLTDVFAVVNQQCESLWQGAEVHL
jgi:hypothetical protein